MPSNNFKKIKKLTEFIRRHDVMCVFGREVELDLRTGFDWDRIDVYLNHNSDPADSKKLAKLLREFADLLDNKEEGSND